MATFQRELKELSARHFLAHLLAHYYPMRPLSHAAKGHAPEEEVIPEEESSDEEYLDDAFVAGGFTHEDEDGDTGRVPSGDELVSDEESLESLSSEGSENSGEDGFVPLPSESEEESESELSSVLGSDSEEDSEAERVYERLQYLELVCPACPNPELLRELPIVTPSTRIPHSPGAP